MKRTVLLVTAVLFTALLAGVAVANDGSNDEFDDTGDHPDLDVGEVVINEDVDVREDDGTLTVSGTYMASDAGYQVVSEELTLEDGEVHATFEIERTGDMAAQVLTPVDFEASLDLDRGSYDLVTDVTVDNETVHEDFGSVSIGEPEEATEPDAHDLDAGEYELDQELVGHDNGGADLTYNGVYMAPDAGYGITAEQIDVDGDQVDVRFEIERTDDMAAQVLTPVEFSATQFLEPGLDYNVNVELVVDEDTVHEETDEIALPQESSTDAGFWGFIFNLLGLG